MSAPAEPPEDQEDQEDFDKFFTVFDGSSPEDVSHARQLWSSLSLLPPQESRLVSADIRQRLPVSRPQQRSSTAAALGPIKPPSVPALWQRQEERQRYATMADQRREILALLRRQREQRIQKELVSVGFKPKKVGRERKTQKIQKDCERDEELVRQLQ
ncbi:UPF0722 protein C11orf88 -like protein [Collichthys lucidus]|uniref:Cilia- and flagella-associated protein HOATZ n=1 Tax=Collichthys lucidus TaxID=240159 RepID=A0A4U5VRP3_COLLU|nr:UPF0722 protein C11orf88 -like protein [Collichthys lucidus]